MSRTVKTSVFIRMREEDKDYAAVYHELIEDLKKTGWIEEEDTLTVHVGSHYTTIQFDLEFLND